eukprot:Selendium_serpulae@DN1672_c0_g1_i2.p1
MIGIFATIVANPNCVRRRRRLSFGSWGGPRVQWLVAARQRTSSSAASATPNHCACFGRSPPHIEETEEDDIEEAEMGEEKQYFLDDTEEIETDSPEEETEMTEDDDECDDESEYEDSVNDDEESLYESDIQQTHEARRHRCWDDDDRALGPWGLSEEAVWERLLVARQEGRRAFEADVEDAHTARVLTTPPAVTSSQGCEIVAT